MRILTLENESYNLETLPDEIDDSLHKLNKFRDRIKGDFVLKLKRMDEITAAFIHKNG